MSEKNEPKSAAQSARESHAASRRADTVRALEEELDAAKVAKKPKERIDAITKAIKDVKSSAPAERQAPAAAETVEA